MLALRVVLTILLTSCVHALYTGEFQSTNWIIDADSNINLDENTMTTVYVALKVRNEEELKQSFQDISNPNSVHYGKYLSMADIQRNYSPTADDIDTVMKYFQTISTGAHAEYRMNQKNDILSIKCKVHELERFFNTKLNWYQHSSSNSNKAHAPFKRSLRALKSLENIPSDIQEKVAFISLNSPINHMKPRSTPNDNNAAERSNSRTNTNADSKLHSFSDAEYGSGITITPGNEEALVNFSPFCGDGSVNSDNPPCSSMSSLDIPQFTVFVTQHANNASNPYQLTPEPLSFELSKPNSVYCVNNITLAPCTGSGQPGKCICTAKIAPLPKYTQLRANLTSTLSSGSVVEVLVSNLFVLTDVATIPFLIDLYNMPSGQLVHNANATQAVAEFYGQYYSNSDLDAFMSLSGKFGANIPDANVRVGVNDPSAPGGEAQLDVEYLMGLAPGASTYFYSIDTLNPYSSENEGFLTWLYAVGNETNPPLVQSLSYGDQEASVFPTDNSAAYDYGMRCEVEFMMLGMRGVSILVSSGDDGIASSSVRDDPAGSCTQAWPEWPASSPYVTTVGATQLTNAYIPICNRAYSSAISSTAPMENNLLFQCSGTGETVCSSSTGGVITSGGGFSNVFDREASAPWQVNAVNRYLAQPWAQPASGSSYYNVSGRAYPDISTYGSNYFVYLDGLVVRESGTSASAPVFSAMVTQWNDIRLTYGLPPMGFVAPWLYDAWENNPEAFNDIVTGNNACGAGHSMDAVNCCDEYFSAAPGWDAVTGLGSPNFGVLANIVLNNATSFAAISAYPDIGLQTESYAVTDDADDSWVGPDPSLIIASLALVFSVLCLLCMLVLGWKMMAYGQAHPSPSAHTPLHTANPISAGAGSVDGRDVNNSNVKLMSVEDNSSL